MGRSPGAIAVDENALQSSGGFEGVARGVENALDVLADLITENLPFGLGFSVSDHVDVDGFLLDRILGSEELPEPTSVAIGGERAVMGNAGARSDSGPEELEGGGELRAAAGGLQHTSGPREGEREFYYEVSGDAGAELKSEDTTNTVLVVVSLTTEDSEQINTLTSLYPKPPGGGFERIDCIG